MGAALKHILCLYRLGMTVVNDNREDFSHVSRGYGYAIVCGTHGAPVTPLM